MNSLKFEYACVVTGDGSPTLSLAPTWEHMHALEGAFTETQYIYQPTIKQAYAAVADPVFISLGLGLAYNEMLIAFEAVRCGQRPALIASYESVGFLKDFFIDWLQDRPSSLNLTYDQMMQLYAEAYQCDAGVAKSFLRELYQSGKLQLLGRIEKEPPLRAHAVLFDAFSNKTSPELWSEEFLKHFFAEAAAQPCFVSTYACNGGLKRALRDNGFILNIQKGFGKKRQSLFAHRT